MRGPQARPADLDGVIVPNYRNAPTPERRGLTTPTIGRTKAPVPLYAFAARARAPAIQHNGEPIAPLHAHFISTTPAVAADMERPTTPSIPSQAATEARLT